MEHIEFTYGFKDEEFGTYKEVKMMRKDNNGNGLTDSEVCEAFMDFMVSAGYSVESVEAYFRDE